LAPSQAHFTPPANPVRGTAKHANGKVHFDLLAKLLADDRRSRPVNESVESNVVGRVESQAHPLLNSQAPSFALQDHRGQTRRLPDLLNRGPLVLVFYLSYACTACAHDLLELSADYARFAASGVEVAGISGDEPAYTRQRFDRFGTLAFPVLADPEHRVAREFGLFKPAAADRPEELLHGTFLIDQQGKILWAWTGESPFRNNGALLIELARLRKQESNP
jgi:peroxiredoxin